MEWILEEAIIWRWAHGLSTSQPGKALHVNVQAGNKSHHLLVQQPVLWTIEGPQRTAVQLLPPWPTSLGPPPLRATGPHNGDDPRAQKGSQRLY